jgi:hypothetical protein
MAVNASSRSSSEPKSEIVNVLLPMVLPQVWGATNRAPNFDIWMATKGWTRAFAFQRRLLQHLQFRKPGRWILKGIYASCLPNLFAVSAVFFPGQGWWLVLRFLRLLQA